MSTENAGQTGGQGGGDRCPDWSQAAFELGFEKWKEVSRERSEANASQKQAATGGKWHLGHVRSEVLQEVKEAGGLGDGESPNALPTVLKAKEEERRVLRRT